MCGIVGIVDLLDERPVDRALLERMNGTQAHRGPDGDGFHLEPGVGFGHRRLSIIDLEGGKQPLYNEDGTVVVTYNGEIYNFQPLVAELMALGHTFKTRCDTEVLVHAWEEWGERSVERFNGMFAFAIWDRNRRTLFLARDRLGIKPLYYTITADSRLLFASELKAILAADAVPRRIQPQAVEDYFAFGYVPDPKTIIEGVFKLAPGHTLKLTRGAGRAAPRQYWDVVFEQRETAALPDLGAELIARLRRSVDMQMVADVPLGAFLSGGVDSSAVVAMMSQVSKTPVRTCSISFGDREFDESRYAALVAEKFGAAHRVERVDGDDLELVDRLAALYDEPYADSSALPTYRVCELARRGVTVALSGDGGDENFGGYRRYRWHVYEEQVRSRVPAALRRGVFGALGRVYPKLDWAPKVLRAKSTLEAIARDSIEGYFHSVTLLPAALRQRLFAPGFHKALQGHRALDVFRDHARHAPSEPLSLVQYLDYKTYLPGDILTKVDRASMAHSLEVRVPILDHELVDWIAGVSPALKLHGREGKYLFKKALEPYLPHDILYRPKMGFAVPLARWFRNELRQRARERLLDASMQDAGIFDRRFVEQMLDQHESGARDFSAPLWALLMFDGFQRNLSSARSPRQWGTRSHVAA
jgi:asparagine synthase (glutamine-hydrolysing)